MYIKYLIKNKYKKIISLLKFKNFSYKFSAEFYVFLFYENYQLIHIYHMSFIVTTFYSCNFMIERK